MSRLRRWSIASAHCRPLRLEWRPSGWEGAALRLLGLLAGIAVLSSAIPRPWAFPLAAAALLHGWIEAGRRSVQPARQLLLPPAPATATCDGQPMRDVRVHWRGPWVFLHWCDADGRRRLAFWPDTLTPARRRELRLALLRAETAAGPPAMAP